MQYDKNIFSLGSLMAPILSKSTFRHFCYLLSAFFSRLTRIFTISSVFVCSASTFLMISFADTKTCNSDASEGEDGDGECCAILQSESACESCPSGVLTYTLESTSTNNAVTFPFSEGDPLSFSFVPPNSSDPSSVDYNALCQRYVIGASVLLSDNSGSNTTSVTDGAFIKVAYDYSKSNGS